MASYQGRPAYVQVADDIRQQITDGTLQAGDRIPSEAELMEDYGVSRIVIRNAMEVVQNEGLVIKQQGRGTFVREQRPLRRRVLGDLYGKRPTGSPMKRATESEGRRSEWEYQSRRTMATKAIADRLALEPGAPVTRTTYRFFADDEPIMLSTSHEPLEITEGTPVEQPEGGTITGVVPRMDSLGLHITHVTEDVNARAPRPYESEALQIGPGVPVMAITRTYYVNDRPVETADIIVAADRYTLTYHVPVPPLS
ncbi:UTRA domain-containing protein [Streptomyces fagopyri]|uniref:UTRA domain-containing protein n=1 Tax=Streptomyces fagopyri TaxID=2662397 RepID=A0A5Q0LBX6_9ACTN|nr:GntR family transcriptional regulator [Streptomyces fagopyri]QFZ74047.1 UTRA domain-containing protein [Streptomyces fagopyri]